LRFAVLQQDRGIVADALSNDVDRHTFVEQEGRMHPAEMVELEVDEAERIGALARVCRSHLRARCWHLEASVRHWQRLAAAKLRGVVVAWRVTVVDRRPRPCVGPAWNGVALAGTIDADVVMLLSEGHRGCRQRRQNSCSGEN